MRLLPKAAISLALIGLVFSTGAIAGNTPARNAGTQSQSGNRSAATHAEVSAYFMRQYAVDQALAPIKTRADLATYEHTHKGHSPLDALTPMNRQLFLDGLKFGKGGVSNIAYGALAGLTPTQAYKILALFGAQILVPRLQLHSVTSLDDTIMGVGNPYLRRIGPFLMNSRCTGTSSGTCTKDQKDACNEKTC